MKTLLCGAAIFAVIAAPVAAETRYDRKLEKAAVGIVASKMGDIRGGFSYKQMPQFVIVPASVSDVMPDMSPQHVSKEASGGVDDGLSPAAERASRTMF